MKEGEPIDFQERYKAKLIGRRGMLQQEINDINCILGQLEINKAPIVEGRRPTWQEYIIEEGHMWDDWPTL